MRSGLHPLMADVIVGHGDKRKDLKNMYVTISDANLAQEIDRMRSDLEETEI